MTTSRIRIRLMDRTRRFDHFRTVVAGDDLASAMLEVHSAAYAIAGGAGTCPCVTAVAMAATNMAHGQMSEDGVTVRTRLLEDNWLLLVRVDRGADDGTEAATAMRLAA